MHSNRSSGTLLTTRATLGGSKNLEPPHYTSLTLNREFWAGRSSSTSCASVKESSVTLSIASAEVTTAEAGMCVYFYARIFFSPIGQAAGRAHTITGETLILLWPFFHQMLVLSTLHIAPLVFVIIAHNKLVLSVSPRARVCTEALIRGLESYSEDHALLFSVLASRPSSLLSVSIRFRGARLLHSPLSSLPHQQWPGWRLPLVSIVRSPRSPGKPNYSPPATKETGAD